MTPYNAFLKLPDCSRCKWPHHLGHFHEPHRENHVDARVRHRHARCANCGLTRVIAGWGDE